MNRSLGQIILSEKPLETLAHLKSEETENYGIGISDSIEASHAHTITILNRLEEHSLVTTEKKSRKKIITLTQEGEELAEAAEDLLNRIEAVEEKREEGDA